MAESARVRAPGLPSLLDLVPTPLVELQVQLPHGLQRLSLKLESSNRSGSIKYRTALSLLSHLHRAQRIDERTTLIESTSGNLGLAVAELAADFGCRFVAVIDPHTPPAYRDALVAAGAEIDVVLEADERGSFLDARLRQVRALLQEVQSSVWVNQYGRFANPAAHYLTTGPEIVAQTDGAVDVVFVAVSTGGTLVGIRRALQELTPDAEVVAVDIAGSNALGLGARGPREGLISGIGASRRSMFLSRGVAMKSVVVSERDAAAACHALAAAGISVGGSSGAAFLAACRYLANDRRATPVVVCPDGAGLYLETLYSADWLRGRNLDLPASSNLEFQIV